MKRQLRLLFALLALSGSFLRAGSDTFPDSYKTTGDFNGHYWRASTDSQNLDMIVGMVEMQHGTIRLAQMRDQKTDGPTANFFDAAFASGHFTMGDIQDEMTKIYQDPRNRRVPIWAAFQVATHTLAGTQRFNADKIEFYRDTLAKFP